MLKIKLKEAIRKIFLLFIFLYPVASDAQNISIPVFRTTDPQKLSEHITKGISNDSEKVVAIHNWITNNIKYDVKKWLNFNYDPVPLNKVLKKRKANCLGYSELFNSLCKYAHLKSVQVNGYVKNMNVDSPDNFYLDEHSWNAVFLNNQWKLLDECWDAGYIKYSKVTFWGHLVKFFTVGKVILVKYKPHFVKAPTDHYFLKNGSYMKRDHMPANPLWQLVSPVVTLKQFKADSSYYFSFPPISSDGRKYDEAREHEREIYFASDENFKTMEDGFAAAAYNKRNHYLPAAAWYAIGENELAKVAPESVNKVEQSELCDSVITCALKALTEYDTNAVYLHKQKSELIANNIIKKNICLQQNNQLIRSTKYALRNLNNGISSSKKNVSYAKRIVKTYKNKLDKLKKSKSFSKKKSAKTTLPTDSLNFYFDVLFTNDSISIQRDSMKQYFNEHEIFYNQLKHDYASYSVGTIRFLSIENRLKITRFEYYDDFDFEVRNLKDTIIYNKYNNDLKLFSDSVFKIKLLYVGLKHIKNNVYAQSAFYRDKARSLTKLKGACVNDQELIEDYKNNLQMMENDYNTFSEEIKKWIKRYNELKSYCKKQKSMTQKELKSYMDEKATEYGFYAVRSAYIKHHYTALINNNKYHIRNAAELKRTAEKLKKKLDK